MSFHHRSSAKSKENRFTRCTQKHLKHEAVKSAKEVLFIMPKSRGYRRKTRALFRTKSRSPLGALLRKYEIGDRVTIDVDSRQTKGMPHRRFQGSVGSVEQVGRRVLRVVVPVGNKTKVVTARFEHVKPVFVQSSATTEK